MTKTARVCNFCQKTASETGPYKFLCSDCIACTKGSRQASWEKVIMLAGMCVAWGVDPPLYTIRTCIQYLEPPYLAIFQNMLAQLEIQAEADFTNRFEPRD